MRIAIGHREITEGYIETTPQGIVITSELKSGKALEGMVNSLPHSHPNWSDEDVIKWYLRRSDGIYFWAFIVPETSKSE